MIIISFSNEVRKEICSSVNDKDKRFACLYGMILYSRTVSPELICFQSESSTAANHFESLMKQVFGKKAEYLRRDKVKKNGSKLYVFEITDKESIDRILHTYRIDPQKRSINSEIIANNSLGVFVAGVFLACGSVNDPSKEYHLEFAVSEEKLADELVTVLGNIGVNSRVVTRRGQYVVYIKGSESIEDTLTFIGAQSCTIELMNVKIFKDVRNKANRIANCDSANIDKVVNTALRQIEDIVLIDKTLGLENLSEELREVAYMRLSNTDMSLKDIAAALETPISRSGVNHRFKKLSAMADEIRSGGEKKK